MAKHVACTQRDAETQQQNPLLAKGVDSKTWGGHRIQLLAAQRAGSKGPKDTQCL